MQERRQQRALSLSWRPKQSSLPWMWRCRWGGGASDLERWGGGQASANLTDAGTTRAITSRCASPRRAVRLASLRRSPRRVPRHAPRCAPRLAAPLTSPRASPCTLLCASPHCAAHLAARLAACLAMRLASRLAVFMLDVLNCTKWNQQLWG